ncbi:hypothetical protein GE09DRAFT_581161 [Coniochaeta sp. 2T2.1]|nr:hypothetical protein GE09DRAFT_581161 [Coniochaeta sp. 2T2.1]
MDRVLAFLPSAEKGYLPYYLFVFSVVAIGNSLQNFKTLHFTRRIYNGRFVPNTSLPPKTATFNPEDSVDKLVPVSPSKATGHDQSTPLAARLFATYTFAVGLIRWYAAYGLENRALYQLGIWTHVIAAAHFTSEMLVFKTVRFGWEHLFPLCAAYVGAVWMVVQYDNYVVN